MIAAIEAARQDADSVGGVLETAIVGLPTGLGEPWFDSLESQLAHAMFSIPAVKGVEFGAGFAMSDWRGSAANDPLRMAGERVVTATNNSGGINGGISNGMPVTFRCAVKPTASIYKEQPTVDIYNHKEENIIINGRHDPCIAHRARVVVDSMAAIVVADALLQRYGNDALK
jgi:chorismate synthase